MGAPHRFCEFRVTNAAKTKEGYVVSGTSGEYLEFVVFIENQVIDTLYKDFKLRDTPSPLLTQEQYKERMAAEGILPEDL